MKAIFISFDQAYYERIVEMLPRLGCRGFTAWQEVQGRGSATGDPHYGTHAWPSLASAMLTVVADERVDSVLDYLHNMDVETPKLGLRAWVLPVERSI
jgi:nitrogen regulatory protein PII